MQKPLDFFSAVLSKIKELARQTAKATGEIKNRIEGIQPLIHSYHIINLFKIDIQRLSATCIGFPKVRTS